MMMFFSSVTSFLSHIRFARTNGFVCTLSGRRRYLPDINADDLTRRGQAERQAVNSVVQGSASDVIKVAMLDVEASDLKCRLLMQIHDELIFDASVVEGGSGLGSVVEGLRECMERRVAAGMKLLVPLVTNFKLGTNWGNLQPYQEPVISIHTSSA